MELFHSQPRIKFQKKKNFQKNQLEQNKHSKLAFATIMLIER